MSEKEYLKKLKRRLSPLKKNDRDSLLDFYKEMIEDKMENGKTEYEAVSELEPVETVAERTLDEYGINRNDPKVKLKTRLSPLAIVLIIVGSPLWIGLAAGAVGAAVGLLCGALAVVVSVVVACVCLTLCGPIVFVSGIVRLFTDVGSGLIAMGSGLVATAIGVIGAIGIYKLTIFIIEKIKNRRNGYVSRVSR